MEWIEVNGAKLEKDYFDANVREAKGHNWSEMSAADLAEHKHCMICWAAIDPEPKSAVLIYASKRGFVCAYCWGHFLK